MRFFFFQKLVDPHLEKAWWALPSVSLWFRSLRETTHYQPSRSAKKKPGRETWLFKIFHTCFNFRLFTESLVPSEGRKPPVFWSISPMNFKSLFLLTFFFEFHYLEQFIIITALWSIPFYCYLLLSVVQEFCLNLAQNCFFWIWVK